MKATIHKNLRPTALAALAGILATTVSVQAALIYSESFDYGDTTTGINTVANWSSGSSVLKYDADTNLTHPSLNHATGGSMWLDYNAARNATDSRPNYDLGALEVGATLWYAALFEYKSGGTSHNLEFRASGSNVSGVFMQITSGGNVRLNLAKSGAVSGSSGAWRNTGETAADSETHLLLLKATKGSPENSPTNGQFHFWLNPGDTSSESALGLANWTASDGLWGRDGTVFASVYSEPSLNGRTDEIRVGTTLLDVIGVLAISQATWDGGGGDWTSANWNTGNAWQDGAEVTFNTPGPQTITVDQAIEVSGLNFNDGGPYAITGENIMTLGGDIHTAPGVTASLSAPVELSAATEKTGTGTLEINGAMTGGILAVSEGTVKGSGSIAGLVIGTNATLEPGNSPGSMSVGELTFEDQAGMVWEFASASLYDQVFVVDSLGSGDLTFEGEVNLTLSPFGKAVIYETDVFTLFTYDGTLDGFDALTTFGVAYGGEAAKWVVQNPLFADTGDAITLTGISYIPEPSTMILAGLGLVALTLRRRR